MRLGLSELCFFNSADIFILPVCIILILPFALKSVRKSSLLNILPAKLSACLFICAYNPLRFARCAFGAGLLSYISLPAFNTALVFLSARWRLSLWNGG